jgi:predicted enzyme related to lactoylglutathione lyase
VAVDDPQATLDAIEAASGRTVMPVTEIPGMVTLAQFQDPAGNSRNHQVRTALMET